MTAPTPPPDHNSEKLPATLSNPDPDRKEMERVE
jgi:hypothetical protein